MKDILLVMSDQHAWWATEFADERIRTSGLRRIAQEGTVFEHCYCNAPLCVPSRMSFLTGRLPSEAGIFDNDGALPMDMPTIAHEMGARGYETVLIGRMHFKGADQNHGFDRRIGGDITSQYWGTGGKNRTDFGAYAGTTNRKHCLEAVGSGYSPVMAYDGMIYREAMKYLEETKDSSSPRFMVVGFYSPHFPFVCGEEKYRKYRNAISLDECRAMSALEPDPAYEDYVQQCSAEHMRNCRAAYCGLVEELDGYVESLYRKFMEKEGEKVFFYTSDHGEQAGKRGIFGKQTLYEEAVHVPLIAAGSGVAKGVNREPVSLLDLSRTLVELGGGEAGPWHQGEAIDLAVPEMRRKPVKIQQILERNGQLHLAQAVTDGKRKEIRIGETRTVYDLQDGEDRILTETEGLLPWGEEAFLGKDEAERLVKRQYALRENYRCLKDWGKKKKPEEPATVKNPEEARHRPEE